MESEWTSPANSRFRPVVGGHERPLCGTLPTEDAARDRSNRLLGELYSVMRRQEADQQALERLGLRPK